MTIVGRVLQLASCNLRPRFKINTKQKANTRVESFVLQVAASAHARVFFLLPMRLAPLFLSGARLCQRDSCASANLASPRPSGAQTTPRLRAPVGELSSGPAPSASPLNRLSNSTPTSTSSQRRVRAACVGQRRLAGAHTMRPAALCVGAPVGGPTAADASTCVCLFLLNATFK